MLGLLQIRPATAADAPGVHAVYAPAVRGSVISFEHEMPSVEEIARRIEADSDRYPWLVAEASDRSIAGYAYATTWRHRAAYRWTCEVSAYVAAPFRKRGLARKLYGELFERLRDSGFVMAVAGITLPNDASVALHEALGFEPAGVFPRCGYKLGGWHDVGFWRLELAERPERPQTLDTAQGATC